MDFGVAGLEGLMGPDNGIASSQAGSEPDAGSPKGNGSGYLKQARSGPGEDEWRASKAARTEDSDPPKTRLNQQGGMPLLLRSNSSISGEDGPHQATMLSFSSPRSEVTFLSKNGGLAEKSTQNPILTYNHQHTPLAYRKSAGYGSGGLNGGGMHGSFVGMRGPFTPSQWVELEQQALIYKYIVANVPVPSNLLIALKQSVSLYALSGSSGSYGPNSLGWGSFHLGFSCSTDPEPGRCRRTDGKKWRCSRDAVADQKYCERHINRGRHRSRKPVEGRSGQPFSGPTAKVAPIACSSSASVMSGGGASNSLSKQFKGLHAGAENPSADLLVNRIQDSQGAPMVSPTDNLKAMDLPLPIPKQHVPMGESSQSEFGLVSSNMLINPSQKSSYMNTRSYNYILDFNEKGSNDQRSFRHFIDDWPKDQSNPVTVAWPEEMKSDWTQLSMSIPMASSDFSSTSSSSLQEKLALSSVRLSHKLDPIQMGLGMSSDIGESTEKQPSWVPIYWGNSMGGPLGEVLSSTSGTLGACKNSSPALNLATELWNGIPQMGSSPTGVLQKSTFVSLSNSSSRSSPRTDTKKTNVGGGLADDIFGSSIASVFPIPML